MGFSTVNGPFPGTQTFSDALLPPPTIYCSLIAKIGGSETVGTGVPLPPGSPGKGPGFVGTAYEQVVPTSGELFFAYNDGVNFADNSGAYTVTVQIVPEPSTVGLVGVAAVGLLRRRSRT